MTFALPTRMHLIADRRGSGHVQALALVSILGLGSTVGVTAVRTSIRDKAECTGNAIASMTPGLVRCGEGGTTASASPPTGRSLEIEGGATSSPLASSEPPSPPGNEQNLPQDQEPDGLSERERAARDLEPGRYDDVPGTEEERINTSTPPPPDGDQCSSSPDKVAGLYDFSFACYAHDLCWQNGSIGGESMTIGACNDEFKRRMRDHCDRRNTGFGSGARENICFQAADAYFAAVSAAGAVKAAQECPVLAATLGPVAAQYFCHPS